MRCWIYIAFPTKYKQQRSWSACASIQSDQGFLFKQVYSSDSIEFNTGQMWLFVCDCLLIWFTKAYRAYVAMLLYIGLTKFPVSVVYMWHKGPFLSCICTSFEPQSQTMHCRMFGQQRFRSACTFSQSDQNLHAAGLGGSVGCAVRLETRKSATFFCGDIFYYHSLPSADSRRAVVSFWWKNVHNTG